MASSPTELRSTRFTAPDGIALSVHELGEGRPLLLLHGYFSDAATNWVRYGHAALLAAAGFRVIMPDLRAHGQSDKPQDAASYPPDILADDARALIAHLGLDDFDLGGYSLGARTVCRLLATGTRPRRAILAGMGLEGLASTGTRSAHFRAIFAGLGSHPKHSPAWFAEAFLKTTGGDPMALECILDSFVDTPRDVIARFDLPVGVICGVDDDDNGSAAALAALLPRAELFTIPGNHMSAVTKPDLGTAMRDFLTR